MSKQDLGKAIRDYCKNCCEGDCREINLCPITGCPLWPFRTGIGKDVDLEVVKIAIKEKCHICMRQRGCTFWDCNFTSFK